MYNKQYVIYYSAPSYKEIIGGRWGERNGTIYARVRLPPSAGAKNCTYLPTYYYYYYLPGRATRYVTTRICGAAAHNKLLLLLILLCIASKSIRITVRPDTRHLPSIPNPFRLPIPPLLALLQ